ncbi:MAG: hypothetical protein KC419_20435 [Anaerolineales bacterium]|nr:hypothetical protein [Anaerolineales bacterium]MCA9930869.1 hypothetical protein [Anaerolineales bacterium]
MVIVIMGEDGSGKSAVGTLLAEAMGCHFYNGDDFHPPENVEKLAQGTPLTDMDLHPWLSSLHNLTEKYIQQRCQAVIACTPLKQSQQDRLVGGLEGVEFVYLNGSYDSLWSRMRPRKLFSQKSNDAVGAGDGPARPANGLMIHLADEPPVIVERIVSALNITGGATAVS